MRNAMFSVLLLLLPAFAAQAEVSVSIATPHVSIGINVPVLPILTRIPGYPVYYAPRADCNYFFFDGRFWVFQDDGWYMSSWYDGPWSPVDPVYVPAYILRVPVRYYRRPPVYFRSWRASEPPHWGAHWGHDWDERRSGWEHWDRHATPKPAPLLTYQRNYSRDRYPRDVQEQHVIRSRHYEYRPREHIGGYQRADGSAYGRSDRDRQYAEQQNHQHSGKRDEGRSGNGGGRNDRKRDDR